MNDSTEFSEVEHSDGKGIREWVLCGPDGAVNFLLYTATGCGLVIGIHVPDDDGAPCDILASGRCRPDQTFLGASRLAERLGSDIDPDVIKSELSDWYASHLSG